FPLWATDAGVCAAICDPNSGTPACPSGWDCQPYLFEQQDFGDGRCVPVSAAGCNLLPAELSASIDNSCYRDINCACPAMCRPDPGGDGGTICLIPCQTSADCPDTTTSCQGGWCIDNPCTTVWETCDTGGSESGFCEPMPYNDQSPLCVQGGTGTLSCEPN